MYFRALGRGNEVVNGTMVIYTLHYLYIDVTGVMGASDDDVIAAHASDSSFGELL